MTLTTKLDLGVTVRDIIQSKSISQLAQRVTLPEKIDYAEDVDTPFDLSPIQKLYFECVGEKWAHFNQSVLLRLSKEKSLGEITSALDSIVKAHSMLRARFRRNDVGIWTQRIGSDIKNSYRFEQKLTTLDQLHSLVKNSQETLDVENGPVFAVSLFEIEDTDQQAISLVAHHLVIDIVSWTVIIQDLEDLLTSQKIDIEGSLPFQIWTRQQLNHTKQNITKVLHPVDVIPAADLAYWDMAGKANIYGDTINDGFEVDPETTLSLLGSCNISMNTDPVDVFLAAILSSFRKVFSDRATAPVFNEGHGREPWPTSTLDLSRTVGWYV